MSATVDTVIEVMRDLAPLELVDLAPDTPFEDTEIDSLVLVEAAVKLTSAYGVSLDDSDLVGAATPAGVVDLIRSRLAATAT